MTTAPVEYQLSGCEAPRLGAFVEPLVQVGLCCWDSLGGAGGMGVWVAVCCLGLSRLLEEPQQPGQPWIHTKRSMPQTVV